MKVKDCMTNNVYSVKTDATLSDVAKMMEQNHIGCVPVCDEDDCLCGIVTDRDIILRGISCEKDPCKTKASDIMTLNVCSCTQDEEMTNAQTKMAQNQIRRLPVCDNDNHVIGMLSIGDIAQNQVEIGQSEVSATLGKICNCNENKNAE